MSAADWLDELAAAAGTWPIGYSCCWRRRRARGASPACWAATLLLAIAGYGIGYYELPNPWLAIPVALLAAASPFLFLRFRRDQRLQEFSRHLPEAIDLMSRALRAGHSVTAAIEIVGEECPEPVRTEFREVYRQQNFGLPAREALVQLAQRIPLPELNFVVTAMLLQKETGGNLVEVLERTTAVIRERLRIRGRDPDLHRAGTADGMDPVAAAGGHVLPAEPGQPRLYPGADRRPDRTEAGLHRPGSDGAGRAGHPQDRGCEGMTKL